MKKPLIIFIVLIVTLTVIVVSVKKEKPSETKIPTFNLIYAVPFDLKPNNALLADDNLILYGENGAYITSYDNPIVNEETKFIDGNVDVFYESKSKKLFVYENRRYIHIYNLNNNIPIFFNKIPMNDSRGEILFAADDLGNVYITEAYKVRKYSIANNTWETFKTGFPDPQYNGSIESISIVDNKPIIGLSFSSARERGQGGSSSWFVNFASKELEPITIEDRQSGTIHNPLNINGRYLLLRYPCECEIKLTDNNIEFVRYFNNLITGSFRKTLIVGNTFMGFYDDNSYELFDINSPLKEVPPFATGTLPFIAGQYELIRYVFNTNVENELIIISYENIYKVKLEI